MTQSISKRLAKSVGQGGKNEHGDVSYIQFLLADWLIAQNEEPLAIDGICKHRTIAAIQKFQKDWKVVSHGRAISDGRIDPNGPTILALEQMHRAILQKSIILNPAFATKLRQSKVHPMISTFDIEATFANYLDALRASFPG